MIKKRFQKNRGVTLIELVVYMALFSLVIPYMFQSLQQVSSVRERALILNEAVASCMFASFVFFEETRQAVSILRPSNFGTPFDNRLRVKRSSGDFINARIREKRFVKRVPGIGDTNITSELLAIENVEVFQNGTNNLEQAVTVRFDCTPIKIRFGDITDPLPFEITTARRVGVGAQI